jgi:Tfp pilus assembly protein PilV
LNFTENQHEAGFSLAEVSIAMSLWIMLILSTSGILWQSLASEAVENQLVAQQLAHAKLVLIRSEQFTGEAESIEGRFKLRFKGIKYTKKHIYEVNVFKKSILYFQLKSVQYLHNP